MEIPPSPDGLAFFEALRRMLLEAAPRRRRVCVLSSHSIHKRFLYLPQTFKQKKETK
jgi:hypothetical protein